MPQPTEEARPRLAGHDRLVVFFLIVGIFLAADLLVKQQAFHRVAGPPIALTTANVNDPNVIPPHDAIVLVPNLLSLKLTINHGAVFGLGAGNRIFFIAITIVAVAFIVTIFWRSERKQHVFHIGLALVLAGALGNLYDRFFFGAVRDMLYLFPGVNLPFGLNWPGGNTELYPWIFNIADAALVLGVALIMFTILRTPKAIPTSEK